MIETVSWKDGAIRLIDQTLLPARLEYVEIRDWRLAAEAIRSMVVRGAPAIGCTAALGMTLAAREFSHENLTVFHARMMEAAEILRGSRPTAVNLFWAVDRILRVSSSGRSDPREIADTVEREAVQMLAEDVEANRRIGEYGAELLPDSVSVLTHCNAGALCAVSYGTALGVVRAAAEAGKAVRVFADETRPRLQGMKLTAWELRQDGIPVTVIADNMAGSLMKQRMIDCVIVGADRIAANGDTANKIGTYGLAVLARHHAIPFYVAAPLSTVDFQMPDGNGIPIEHRSCEEMTRIDDARLAPDGVDVLNPAFDVTPNELVSRIITDRGIADPPFVESLKRLSRNHDRGLRTS